MPDDLTPAQRALAQEVALRHGASPQLLGALERDELTDDERNALGDLVTEDLAVHGFDADHRPTDLGRRLEDLIDVLNSAS